MKQIFQDLAGGETMLLECPAAVTRPGRLLIETSKSLISAGTERMLVDFGRSGYIAKARSQPDKVRQVLDKVKTDGLLTTVDAVRSKLSQPLPLGYSNVGRVARVGKGVSGFSPGDRVVSNGPHADLVSVAKNLCAKIPDGVDDETASFTVVSAIALQGIRLAQPTLGERFVVTGAGLIGLLAIQLLLAHGCRVLAIDFDDKKLALAKKFGAEVCNPAIGQDPVAAGMAYSNGVGVDGVIITASTTSNDPVSQAAKMSRKRGRIVLVGVTGLQLNRSDFYEKELSFQVSCSYGPGRYDPEYEDKGHDYPIGHVRWTQQRNFDAVLNLMASGAIQTSDLVSHRISFDQAPEAYDRLMEDKGVLGVVLEYDSDVASRHKSTVELTYNQATPIDGAPRIGVVGAGNYASRVLIPALKSEGAQLVTLASQGGASAALSGKSLGFKKTTSDTNEMIEADDIDALVIATRHDSHANLTQRALAGGKHVFVEKPLALSRDELVKVRGAFDTAGDRQLMVGFNRRFSPLSISAKKLLANTRKPKSFIFVMNAGEIPLDHWVHDPLAGGGRIIGEACHHIDLMRFFADSPIVSIEARRMGDNLMEPNTHDKAVIVLGFQDGSFGTIHYLANGGSAFPKERCEIFVEGRTLQIDNFVALRGFNWPGFRTKRLLRQDKGQRNCCAAFLEAIANGGSAPIHPEELFEVHEALFEAADQLANQT